MIGERLAEIRKDHGDNQDDLARKLNVSVFAIRSWEQEKAPLPMSCWCASADFIRSHPITSWACPT